MYSKCYAAPCYVVLCIDMLSCASDVLCYVVVAALYNDVLCLSVQGCAMPGICYGALRYAMLAVLCNKCAVLYCAMLCRGVLCRIVLCCAVPCHHGSYVLSFNAR